MLSQDDKVFFRLAMTWPSWCTRVIRKLPDKKDRIYCYMLLLFECLAVIEAFLKVAYANPGQLGVIITAYVGLLFGVGGLITMIASPEVARQGMSKTLW